MTHSRENEKFYYEHNLINIELRLFHCDKITNTHQIKCTQSHYTNVISDERDYSFGKPVFSVFFD